MARITCQEPSTGKPLNIAFANISTSFITIANAPDFSVPDEAEEFTERDPLDANRAIRPGEIFFLTPLTVRNKSVSNPIWIDVQLVTESGVTVQAPGRITVPPNDSVTVSLQGRSLLKRDPASANGDRVQVRAQSSNTLDVWCSAEERLSSEHIGEVV